MIHLLLFPWLLGSTGVFLPVFVLSRRLLFHASLSFFPSLQLYRKLKWPFFFSFSWKRSLASRSVQPRPPVCDWPVGSVRARRRVASGLLVFSQLQPPLVVLRCVHVSVGSRGRFPGGLSLLYQAAALQARQKQRRRDEISLALGGNVRFAARLQLE